MIRIAGNEVPQHIHSPSNPASTIGEPAVAGAACAVPGPSAASLELVMPIS